ncbi:MAG: hypothetical protein MUC48_17340 [Leptolyngbya sp. Prado105]|nr:hypothetical protein [Leptolyngbya sp. Prado105]
MLVLLRVNGAGKSSILESISLCLNLFVNELTQQKPIDKLKQQAPTGNWSSAILEKAIQTVSQRHDNAHLEYFPYIVFHLKKRFERAKMP